MMEGNQILGDKRNHKVNPKKKTRISHFYTIVIGYLLQLACSYRKKDTHNDAHKVY